MVWGDSTMKNTLAYFLPKAKIAASVSQLLKAFPEKASGEAPVIETTAAIRVRYDPDPARPVVLNLPRGNIFGGRSLDLKLREDGTLISANSEFSGAGGEAVAAIFKASAALLNAALPIVAGKAVAAFGAAKMGPLVAEFEAGRVPTADETDRPRKEQLTCLPEIEKTVSEAAELRKTLAVAEAKADGGISTPVDITDLKARLAALEEKLTLTAAAVVDVPTTGEKENVFPAEWKTELAPFDYTKWFGTHASPAALKRINMPGRAGYIIKVTTIPALLAAIRDLPAADGSEDCLSCLMPVPGFVTVCSNTETDGDGTLASASAFLPQLSPVFRLPLTGGAFSNRIISLTLTESGTDSSISYKTQAELAGIAAAVSGAAEAMKARRDNEQAEQARALTGKKTEYDLLDTQKKIDDLLKKKP
jgi:hypothetical protein